MLNLNEDYNGEANDNNRGTNKESANYSRESISERNSVNSRHLLKDYVVEIEQEEEKFSIQ